MEIKRPDPKQRRPKDAQRVFKGQIFDVYQWQEKLFDGSTGTWEVVKRADTVVVIPITPEGKIVILEQEQPARPPFLSFPGGRADEGEDVVATAKRELREETGYEARELVLFRAHQPLTKVDWAIYTFMAYGCVKKYDQDLDAGEKISTKEITFEESLNLVESGKLADPGYLEMVLRARLDPSKMSELKKLFTPR